MENRPVDPGSIQGSHRPISFIRIKHRTRADDVLCKTEYFEVLIIISSVMFTKPYFIKSWKTSAVSTTVWMVETQLIRTRLKLSFNHSNGCTHSCRFNFLSNINISTTMSSSIIVIPLISTIVLHVFFTTRHSWRGLLGYAGLRFHFLTVRFWVLYCCCTKVCSRMSQRRFRYYHNGIVVRQRSILPP